MSLVVVGAGMAGLLAANLLRHHDPVVVEAQKSLPHNHSAVLRFRSSLVGEVLGIPFRKVRVIKGTVPWRNPVADSLAYSMKNLGKYLSDRSILSSTTEAVERWIAPPDLIERMSRNVEVRFGTTFDFSASTRKVLSTIPMPSLMMALDYKPIPYFGYVAGTNIKAKVNDCDAFVSLAVPDPAVPFSRVSITGDELIVECPGSVSNLTHENAKEMVCDACEYLGLDHWLLDEPSVHPQLYAKIAPIDEHIRKSFIFHASSVTGKAFSLGRFATWRPGLMLDDLVSDIRLIDSWITSATPGYDMDIHRGKK